MLPRPAGNTHAPNHERFLSPPCSAHWPLPPLPPMTPLAPMSCASACMPGLWTGSSAALLPVRRWRQWSADVLWMAGYDFGQWTAFFVAGGGLASLKQPAWVAGQPYTNDEKASLVEQSLLTSGEPASVDARVSHACSFDAADLLAGLRHWTP